MRISDYLNKNTTFIKADLATKEDVLQFLANNLLDKKYISDYDAILAGLHKRESEGSTGVGDAIAIPHTINKKVAKPSISVVTLANKIDWQSLDDQPVDLIFMITTPDDGDDKHLQALASLAGFLGKQEVVSAIRNAKSFNDIVKIFDDGEAKKEASTKQNTKTSGGAYDLVGITACPTGIAHTYMAAEKLQEYASQMGYTIKVETQGRRGVEDKLTQEDVDNAKGIILAHDKALTGLNRFDGKQVIDTGTKEAIFKGKELIEKAIKKEGTVEISHKGSDDDGSGELSLKKFKDVKGNLLAGVSRMLPFVVAGGIVLGIGFLLDYIWVTANGYVGVSSNPGMSVDAWNNLTAATNGVFTAVYDGTTYYYSGNFGNIWIVAHSIAGVGKIGMELMIPILAAYVCYSIVGPQGLMVGAVAGLLANGDSFVYGASGSWSGAWSRWLPSDITSTSSGFIGALVGAYLGAFAIFGITKMMKNIGKSWQGPRDIVFIPVLSLIAIAVIMLAINIPLGYLMWGIQWVITALAEHNILWLVTIIIAAMMCVDMGGPINKVAYLLGTLSVGNQLITDVNSQAYDLQSVVMTASLTGGMVPPLAIAISTVLFPKQWASEQRTQAKANWIMGATFISEGAIPFMIEDPKRIPVSSIIGGAITGAIIGIFQITITAPHGGIFVAPLTNAELFNNASLAKGMGIAMFFVAVLAGSFVAAVVLGFWRTSDIRNGKLVLNGTNGVKDGIQIRIETTNAKLANAKNDKEKTYLQNKLAKLEAKLNNYADYEVDLAAKQQAHLKLVEQKNAQKQQKNAK